MNSGARCFTGAVNSVDLSQPQIAERHFAGYAFNLQADQP
jgi:hypothetical protein